MKKLEAGAPKSEGDSFVLKPVAYKPRERGRRLVDSLPSPDGRLADIHAGRSTNSDISLPAAYQRFKVVRTRYPQ